MPVGPDDVTAGWVSEVLGRSHDIGSVVRIGEDYGFASELYRVETSGDDVERLIVKLWDTTTRAGVRELQFYEHLAEKCPIPPSAMLSIGFVAIARNHGQPQALRSEVVLVNRWATSSGGLR